MQVKACIKVHESFAPLSYFTLQRKKKIQQLFVNYPCFSVICST